MLRAMVTDCGELLEQFLHQLCIAKDWKCFRSGRLSSHELKEALQGYGRTLIALPDDAFRLAEVYPVKGVL